MPIVRIELFPGRSDTVKGDIARQITEAFHSCAGVKPADTIILFNEVPPSDWFEAGESFGEAQKKE